MRDHLDQISEEVTKVIKKKSGEVKNLTFGLAVKVQENIASFDHNKERLRANIESEWSAEQSALTFTVKVREK